MRPAWGTRVPRDTLRALPLLRIRAPSDGRALDHRTHHRSAAESVDTRRLHEGPCRIRPRRAAREAWMRTWAKGRGRRCLRRPRRDLADERDARVPLGATRRAPLADTPPRLVAGRDRISPRGSPARRAAVALSSGSARDPASPDRRATRRSCGGAPPCCLEGSRALHRAPGAAAACDPRAGA